MTQLSLIELTPAPRATEFATPAASRRAHPAADPLLSTADLSLVQRLAAVLPLSTLDAAKAIAPAQAAEAEKRARLRHRRGPLVQTSMREQALSLIEAALAILRRSESLSSPAPVIARPIAPPAKARRGKLPQLVRRAVSAEVAENAVDVPFHHRGAMVHAIGELAKKPPATRRVS
jgi:hypothetical protein